MPLKIPRENANDNAVMITAILCKSGNLVEEGQDLIEIETSKAAIVVPAPAAGIFTTTFNVGDEISVGEQYGTLTSPDHEDGEQEDQTARSQTNNEINSHFISDRAQDILEVGNTNVSSLSKWVTSRSLTRNTPPTPLHSEPSKEQRNVLLPHSVNRSTIRKRAEVSALRQAATGQLQSTIGITVVDRRRQIPELAFAHSILDLVTFETAQLLKEEFSDLNRFYISDEEYGQYDIVVPGISLDNNHALTVCAVYSDIWSSLPALRKHLLSLFERFEDRQLSSHDLGPATFTISDLSNTQSNYMLPLINGRQTLILGICKYDDGYKLYATFDHRISEGLRVAKFLELLRVRIESHFVSPIEAADDVCCDFCLKSLRTELELGNLGLLKIRTATGEKNICRTCYEGW